LLFAASPIDWDSGFGCTVAICLELRILFFPVEGK
jgi:hypothetical protein